MEYIIHDVFVEYMALPEHKMEVFQVVLCKEKTTNIWNIRTSPAEKERVLLRKNNNMKPKCRTNVKDCYQKELSFYLTRRVITT